MKILKTVQSEFETTIKSVQNQSKELKTFFVQKVWAWIQDLWLVLKPCRFSWLMMLIGLVFLSLVGQGQDTLRALVEARAWSLHYFVMQTLFVIAALAWAFNSWYFAHIILVLKRPSVHASHPHSDQNRILRFRVGTPKWIGKLCLLGIGIAHFSAAWAYRGTSDRASFYVLMAWGVLFILASWLFVAMLENRQKITGFLQQILLFKRSADAHEQQLNGSSTVTDFGVYDALRDLPGPTKIIALTMMGLAVVLFLIFVFAPIQAGQTIGAATILLLAASGWIPFGSLLIYLSYRTHLPLFILLLAWAVLISPLANNHALRRVADSDLEALAYRPGLKDYFRQWFDKMERDFPKQEVHPLVVVAAEGGGIRAAYWTAAVLSEIQDKSPCFSRHVFAMSGVSGGSLGAGLFTALAAEQAEAGIDNCRRPGKSNNFSFEQHTKVILGQDFLSPALGMMLYPDLFQRIVPFEFNRFDRSLALEQGWERAWNKHFGGDGNRLGDSFLSLWKNQNQHGIPALILNGTSVETGKRVLVSNLDVGEFSDVIDFHMIGGYDIPLSTAMHMSARFTYVSPAGTITDANNEKIWGHVVDGGYFENSGAASIYEVLRILESEVALDYPERWKKVLPIVIIISNEPKDEKSYGNHQQQPNALRFMGEMLSPIVTLLNTRSARGSYSVASIEHLAKYLAGSDDQGQRFFRFDLEKSSIPIPLGWQLSKIVQQEINRQLKDNSDSDDNGATIQAIAQLLDPRS